MATHKFCLTNHTAGSSDVFIRVFGLTGGEEGQVFDFNDSTMKAIGSATTPYASATEITGPSGTKSAYVASVDLNALNPSGTVKQYFVEWYEDATPDVTDDPITGAPVFGFFVQFGEYGEREVAVQCEVNVKSTSGTTAQLSVWLEHDTQLVDIDTVDGSATARIRLREHGGASDLIDVSFTVSDLTLDVFQKEASLPNFQDDREYTIIADVVENSKTHSTTHSTVVIG